MQSNKFFNDSSNTSTGKPKFMPPQKRQELVPGDSAFEERPVEKENKNDYRREFKNDFRPQTQQNYQGNRSNFGQQGQGNFGNKPYGGQQQGGYGHYNHHSHHQHSHQHQSHSVDPTQGHHSQSYARDDNQGGKKYGGSLFGRNRSNYQSNWGYRHLRTGHVDKEVEEEEKALFESNKSASINPLVENVQNYDHLKVEVTNKFGLTIPQIQDTFKDLSLSQCLMDNIERCGYQKLTIIQRNSIPIISSRLNIMASSQTGSGKTASFLIPIIQNLLNSGPPKNDVSKEEFKKTRKCYPLAVIMAPTRELAIQIHEEARKFCHLTGVLAKVIYGGKEAYNQQRYLSWDGCDILIATPGRLIDFMGRIVDFSFVRFIVLDEADRMLDMGFEPQIRDVMDKCFADTQGEDITVAMFSATFPKEVRGLAEKYLQKYVYVGIGTEGKTGSVSKTIKQELIDVRHQSKNLILFDTIKNLDGKILIFCATKKAVANVYTYLSSKNLFVANIHGDLSQKDREAELGLFKSKCSILIATDVASRGLDIPDVAYVLNYDLPTNIESYIHRIGRTGRIGKAGTAISFLADLDEPMFSKVYGVLKDSNQEIPQWFQELVRSRYQREERYPQNQNRFGKPSHHKWRGGFQQGGNRGGYQGGNRNFGNRGGFAGGFNNTNGGEDIGYDSDYTKNQYTGGGYKGAEDAYGYE
jgi:ATP-dependent RNA helicase DDX3X